MSISKFSEKPSFEQFSADENVKMFDSLYGDDYQLFFLIENQVVGFQKSSISNNF